MAQETLEKLSEELSATIERASQSVVLVQGKRLPSSGIVWKKNSNQHEHSAKNQ